LAILQQGGGGGLRYHKRKKKQKKSILTAYMPLTVYDTMQVLLLLSILSTFLMIKE
jgi:hypothetical protein